MRQVAVANEMMTVGHVVTLTMPAAAPSVAVANEMMTVGHLLLVAGMALCLSGRSG